MLRDAQIGCVPTTVKNPQSNGICERMHQSIGNTLATMQKYLKPNNVHSTNNLVDYALSACLFATRAAIHGTLKATPGSLAFGRDMILDIPILTDWKLIQDNRQQMVDKTLL